MAGRCLMTMVFVCGAALGNVARAEDSLELLPSKIALAGPQARQSLVVEERQSSHFVGQIRDGVELTSSDPKIVRIENNVAVPVANGSATITAMVGSRMAKADVTVTAMDQPFAWSFRNHVEAVLAKSGCNTGACHGALAGKKGFRLSLAGYDPLGDYYFITRQARSRRVVLGDPGRSLLLTKPTGAIPHKGGIRFGTDSPDYRVIAEWIAAGAPEPRDNDPKLNKLEILPAAAVLKPGAKQQLIVLAHFNDGHVEDVTRWAKYTSTLESVAQVGTSGLVDVTGHGEGAIKAWFQSWNVVATITSPYDQPTNDSNVAQSPRKNFIDDLVLAKLQSLNIPPSPPATDAEFLRRAYLDTIGVLPTEEEARVYLADASTDKANRLIEHLLARPEFVDYWTYKWSDLLLVNSGKLPPPAMWAYYHWIRNRVAADTPWDQFARDVVTATGSTLENGAANFYVLHQDPLDAAETVSVAFLGMSINCARCHNHPLEKWTNDQYYSMANMFSRVRAKDGTGAGNRIIFPVAAGELTQPRTGKPQPPQPLDGVTVPMDSTDDRRQHLADWLVAPENPYFSRAVTNRVWANFFGVGLVENVDDLRLTNPPSNPDLMNAAAKYLVDQKYDLKALMRAILQSSTYARSSQPLPGNQTDGRFYSRYYPKRLMAEVMLDAISQVSGTPTDFFTRVDRNAKASYDYPKGFRAIQLPDANVNSYFLQSFGRAERIITCECERSSEPSMVQVLHISNGDTVNKKLAAPGSRVEKLLAAKTPDGKIIEEAYLAALTRYPTEQEKSQLLAALSEAGDADKRVMVEDLFWSVLSSKEFLFNK